MIVYYSKCSLTTISDSYYEHTYYKHTACYAGFIKTLVRRDTVVEMESCNINYTVTLETFLPSTINLRIILVYHHASPQV